MANNLHSDAPIMAEKIKQIKQTHETLNNALNQFQTEADGLTAKGTWQGAAASQFQQFMEAYATQAKAMNQQLGETADKLGQVKDQLTQHDEDHAQQVAKQVSSLQGL